MKKENVFKNCKKLTASFVAALLLVCSSGVSADVFAKAEDAPVVYGTGCIPDSKAVLEKNQATDAEIYDLDYINESNTVTYNSLVNVCKAANLSALPETVDISNQFPAPGNQGVEGSCTAWAVAYGLKSHQEYLEHGWDLSNPKAQYSPAYVYNQINGGKDEGSSVSVAMELITNQGVCSLYNMKYSQYDYLTQPNESQKDMASNFKASSWRSIYGVEAVKEQLADNQGVAIVVACYPDFDDIGPNNETYDVINSGDIDRAYHAICLVGYDDANQRFKFMNSWGPKWGLNGYGYISYDMFNDDRNDSGWAYVLEDEKHSDSEKFFTSVPSTGCVKATSDVRLYTSPDYYRSSDDKDYYYHTVNPGTKIKIDSFVSSSNGMQPYFKTSDGYYINAQKTQLEVADSNDLINNILINGNENNSVSSISNSETSRISFTSNSNVKYNNHNTLKIDYTVNQSDSYNGYAGAKISGDTTVSTNGATGIGFWYMTPAGQSGTVALCMQGSVSKKIAQIPTTNGEWKYYYNTYNFNGSNMSDIEIYINGSENNCVTSPATGTIYIAELAATNGVADDDKPSTYYSFSVKAGEGGTVSGKNNGNYLEGTTMSVTAEPKSGYIFLGWSDNENGEIISTNKTYTTDLTKDISLYAYFVKSQKSKLTVIKPEGCDKIIINTADRICKEFENGNYYQGKITLEAVGKEGYTFKGWYTNAEYAGVSLSSSVKYTFNFTGETVLYPKFVKDNQIEYTVEAVKTTGCENILLSSSKVNAIKFTSGKFEPGQRITLFAISDDSHVFKAWYTNSDFSGTPVSTSESFSFTVNSDIKLYPKFDLADGYYQLTTNSDSNGTVFINKNGPYKNNTSITVSVIPNSGYEFTGWTNGKYGELISTDAQYKFNIKEDTNLYAHFKKLYYHVTIDCSALGTSVADSTGYYGKYASVTAQAKPNDDNYVFDCWKDNDGNVVSRNNPYYIYLDSDVELYAQFVKKSDKCTVTLVKGQNGTFSGASTRTYNDGAKASITATPNAGYKFVGWKIYGTNILVSKRQTYNFYVTEDVKYQPVFDKENSTVYHYLGVYSAEEGGSVSKVTGYHEKGQNVQIKAVPADGYKFTGWTNKAGDTVSTKSQLTVNISNSKYFYAHFEKIPYHTVELVNGKYGAFTGEDLREYREGEKASITAVPDKGYKFVGWKIYGTNILVSKRQTYNFFVTEDVKYQPLFDKDNSTVYHYLGVYSATEGGSVSKVTGYHVKGENVSIEAIPADGYKFIRWTNKAGDTLSTKSQLTVNMSNSKYFYAHFEKISN